MKNQIWAWILKAPLLLIMLGAFIGGIYAASKAIAGVTYATPIILGIFIALYIIGEVLANKK